MIYSAPIPVDVRFANPNVSLNVTSSQEFDKLGWLQNEYNKTYRPIKP